MIIDQQHESWALEGSSSRCRSRPWAGRITFREAGGMREQLKRGLAGGWPRPDTVRASVPGAQAGTRLGRGDVGRASERLRAPPPPRTSAACPTPARPHPVPAASPFALAASEQRSGESPAAALSRLQPNPMRLRVWALACTYPTPSVRRSAPKLEHCRGVGDPDLEEQPVDHRTGTGSGGPARDRFRGRCIACHRGVPCQRPAPRTRSGERSIVAERSC